MVLHRLPHGTCSDGAACLPLEESRPVQVRFHPIGPLSGAVLRNAARSRGGSLPAVLRAFRYRGYLPCRAGRGDGDSHLGIR